MPKGTQPAARLRWTRQLPHLNLMNQLSRPQYFHQYGVYMIPAGQEVRGEFFYNHYILIYGYKGLSFLPDYRYNFFYGCRSLLIGRYNRDKKSAPSSSQKTPFSGFKTNLYFDTITILVWADAFSASGWTVAPLKRSVFPFLKIWPLYPAILGQAITSAFGLFSLVAIQRDYLHYYRNSQRE